MRYQDIDKYDNYPYTRYCDGCGKLKRVYTQGFDQITEYWTDVYVECECGNLVKFHLPVN